TGSRSCAGAPEGGAGSLFLPVPAAKEIRAQRRSVAAATARFRDRDGETPAAARRNSAGAGFLREASVGRAAGRARRPMFFSSSSELIVIPFQKPVAQRLPGAVQSRFNGLLRFAQLGGEPPYRESVVVAADEDVAVLRVEVFQRPPDRAGR